MNWKKKTDSRLMVNIQNLIENGNLKFIPK